MEAKFLGTIKSGKLELSFKDYFLRYLRNFREGTLVHLVVKEARRQRTSGKDDEKSNENGYYWGVVIPVLADEFGYSSDEMHEALKIKFMRTGGTDELPRIGSTARLNTKDWENLMEKIRIWALTEHDIKIPLPNEADY